VLIRSLVLNITSILLKKIILESDSETWSRIRKHYLPVEYHPIYNVINSCFEDNSTIPSFEVLELSTRKNSLLDKIYALKAVDTVDIDNNQLLEYLKNEYTQEEIMTQISKYLSESIMMESAKENVAKLQDIILHVESKVDLKDPAEDMQRIELFASQEELAKAMCLGLNSNYDSQMMFAPTDYILMGGVRGSGKSLTSANVAVNAYEKDRSAIYFTIEMSARATLQRMASIATGVPAKLMRLKKLSHGQFVDVARFWSGRFEHGEEAFQSYQKHHSFDILHKDLSKMELHPTKQLDVVYDPTLSLASIRSELDKKVAKLKPAVILVDYINQVRRNSSSPAGQYEWTEQIEISKALKALAQEYEVPIVSPYQIDASGEARFSKGILDSADAAFILNPHNKEDNCVTFKCVKMRDSDEVDFTSKMNWDTLKMGPDSVEAPSKAEEKKPKKLAKPPSIGTKSNEEIPFDL